MRFGLFSLFFYFFFYELESFYINNHTSLHFTEISDKQDFETSFKIKTQRTNLYKHYD
jgi:hypothetical protein